VSWQSTAWNDLSKTFDTANSAYANFNKLAGTYGPSGNTAQDTALNYYMPILSGDRNAMNAAVAPEARAIRAQGDAARAERARTGTSRTGGDVAANLSSADQIRQQLDTLIGNVRPQAAQAVNAIGSEKIDQMMKALGLGTSALSVSANSAGMIADTAGKAHEANMAALGGIAKLGAAIALLF
jgi:hypothetical protein